MKPFLLALSVFTVLLAACSGDSIVGPGENERALEPTGGAKCSINTRLC